MDLVLAPSRFIEEAVRSSCPETPVVHYPQAVFLPEGIAPDRERFGLNPSSFVCLSVLDAKSGLERKNPLASIAAFQHAFSGMSSTDVQLVIKMTSRDGAQRYSAQIDELMEHAAGDDRIVVIEKSMDYAHVLSLSASADVLISLHRSEGLGLNLMEAMSLGTVVVGTGWSGNMDFMTPNNSVVVSCSRVPVESAHPSYASDIIGPGQFWMEPDVREAGLSLRRVYDDRTLLRSLATQARADMENARVSFRQGDWIGSVRTLLENGALESRPHENRSRSFNEVMRVVPAQRVPRQLIRLARWSGWHR
ncbi:MAG: glycosyltransferase [Coriobacteriia bacterium]